MTLQQIKKDPRVSAVELNADYDPDYSNSEYLLWLRDGFVFSDGSHVAGANSVKELNELLREIETE